MRVLGIDTAIRCTGYGLVDCNNGRIDIVDCGIIQNKHNVPHSECLRRLGCGIRELIHKFNPDVAALESAFYSKNVKTAMILSYARGAIMFVLAENKIPIYAYAPKKAKMAIGGSGSSSKLMIAQILSSMLSIDINQINLDATDALAIAICHGQLASRPGSEFFIEKPL
ncbi:MAG TPA: crossover junction endodeoxyribonuclease RuvC [Victivallales bacterium]|nr:crossover junction endodeoxyribonuclease RuvC [Victivallales bacterium]HRR29355.1 crossover junction endodeoxyribonuclease RuvC [Victivallales bacterium]